MSNIVRGTMLLTGATFLSKFLGMIYVIPFNELVGETGGTLFNFAYTPYNILISISTIGVPLAVSKFVSKYNSLGDYETGMRIFRTGIMIMLVTGLVAFLSLFLGADYLASKMVTNDASGDILVSDVAMVLRMVSFALIIIPAMSIVRGFFQGYQSMGPTAISQVVEQIVRIVFLLAATYIVIKIYQGTIATAVGLATFAAFVGGLASCFILWLYWKKRKGNIKKNIEKQKKFQRIPTKDLFIELFSYAGPFVIVSLATPLYQLVDQFTFERAMTSIGYDTSWAVPYAAINFYGHKLVIIPVTIATGLSLAILPALTKAYTQNKFQEITKQINQALQIIVVLVVPAVVGLVLLSDVAYGTLFGLNHISVTGPLLAWYAPVSLLFALFIVSSSMLQGINQQRFAVISLSAGLLLKVVLNIKLIQMFGAKGAIFGTAIAVFTALVLNLWRMKLTIHFSFKQTVKRFVLVLILCGLMAITILGIRYLLGLFLPYETSRLSAMVLLFAGVSIGGFVYLWLGYQTTLLERVLGGRVKVLEKFLRKI
ncbi:oligosaccharide flippase family protein [Ornithinibacillus sp. 4-3]|uniref:Oligosaccharide flippase family protein n=1 Tax=Ornithinibacillus sp. 4-3 TaxID=3231488 RepID=A0AB39HN58_9BACI